MSVSIFSKEETESCLKSREDIDTRTFKIITITSATCTYVSPYIEIQCEIRNRCIETVDKFTMYTEFMCDIQTTKDRPIILNKYIKIIDNVIN